jgi:hypothetical protein
MWETQEVGSSDNTFVLYSVGEDFESHVSLVSNYAEDIVGFLSRRGKWYGSVLN